MRCNTEIMLPFVMQVSELISKLEDERNQLQEQLERAATRETEVLQQVMIYITHFLSLLSSSCFCPHPRYFTASHNNNIRNNNSTNRRDASPQLRPLSLNI